MDIGTALLLCMWWGQEEWHSFEARKLVSLFPKHVFGEMELFRDPSSCPRGIT